MLPDVVEVHVLRRGFEQHVDCCAQQAERAGEDQQSDEDRDDRVGASEAGEHRDECGGDDADRRQGVGEILADHSQYTLYRYEKDSTSPPKSNCVEPAACTLTWAPLLTAEVETTSGIDASLLGMIQRPSGPAEPNR